MADFRSVAGEYAQLWDSLKIEPTRAPGVNAAADRVIKGRTQYETVSKATGVPWYVVGLLHYRESNCNFNTHLHNGDPLSARTVHVPAGRPRGGNPPYDWAFSAIDALVIKGLDKVTDWTIERVAYTGECFNGWGYRAHGGVAPYLWSGTCHYVRGKFIRDHVYSPTVVDPQLGIMAVLSALISKGAVASVPRDGTPRPAPKAEPPPLKPQESRTIMGALYVAFGLVVTFLRDVFDVVPKIVDATRQLKDPVDQLLSTAGVEVPYIGMICAAAGLMLVIYARYDAHNQGKIG